MFIIVSFILLVVGAITRQDAVLVTSGLFSIAGAIEVYCVRRDKEKEVKEHE